MEPILVVDAGTATTTAYVVGDGEPQPLLDSENSPFWPTAAARDGDRLLVGAAAGLPSLTQGLFRGQFLDALGRDGHVLIDGHKYSATELLSELLRTLRTEAMRLAGRAVGRILLTVPDEEVTPRPAARARFGLTGRGHPAQATPARDLQRMRAEMIAAARDAGFTDVELLSEAAAVAMGTAEAAASSVLVCDAGASALRITLVQLSTEPGFVRAGRAIGELGGDSQDLILAEEIQRQRTARRRRTVTAADAAAEVPHLANLAERVRRGLTDSAEFADPALNPADPDARFARRDFERLLRQPAAQIAPCCEEVLAAASLTAAQLSDVLLVGGWAKSPFLAKALSQALRRPVTALTKPDLACVDGAVRWASQAPGRRLAARPHVPGVRALAWDIDRGGGTLTHWLKSEGEPFPAGEPLARMRLDDDRVRHLVCDGAGILLRQCVPEGVTVNSGDVLAVTRVRVAGPWNLAHEPYLLGGLPTEKLMVFDPDGEQAVVRDVSGALALLDLDTRARVGAHWAGPPGSRACDVVLSRDGDWLGAFFTGKAFETRDMATGQRLGRRVRYRASRGGLPAAVRFAARGEWTCLLDGRRLRVRMTTGRDRRYKFKLRPFGRAEDAFACSRDGSTLVIASRGKRKSPDGAVVAWDLTTFTCATLCPLPRDTGAALLVAVAADGGQVLIAVDDVIDVRDVPSTRQRWSARVPGPVTAAALSGVLVAAVIQGPSDSSIIVWDARDGTQLHEIPRVPPASSILISPDARFLVTGTEEASTLWGLIP